MIHTTTDRQLLHRHFLKDKVLFAYHIGDLDPFFFPDCRWIAKGEESTAGVVADTILVYTGLDTPTVLAFGVGKDYGSFMQEALSALPDRFYGHYQEISHAVLIAAYDERPLGGHLKMHRQEPDKLASLFRPDGQDPIKRLNRDHLGQLLELYGTAYPDNYFDPRMLDTGKYFGYIEDDRIIAVGGIHVYSRQYDIAVLGNVTTALDKRGRGLATLVTARLLEDLLAEGIGTICLNVAEDNAAAIHCYEKLGFEVAHRYREGLFTRR